MGAKVSLSTRVASGENGVYRWTYELNLYKNPTVFLTVWKIFFFILLGIFGTVAAADLVSQGASVLPGTLRVFVFVLVGMTAVVGLSCLIYAWIMGGSYTVEFEMSEKGVSHRQVDFQAKKAKKLAAAAAIAGAASGNRAAVGAGMSARRTEMYSDFARIKKVKACPRRHLIKVDGTFSHNQVYAAAEDFAFVYGYIVSHCPNLKKKA